MELRRSITLAIGNPTPAAEIQLAAFLVNDRVELHQGRQRLLELSELVVGVHPLPQRRPAALYRKPADLGFIGGLGRVELAFTRQTLQSALPVRTVLRCWTFTKASSSFFRH